LDGATPIGFQSVGFHGLHHQREGDEDVGEFFFGQAVETEKPWRER